jgi:SAM-dependent methyltransferase
MENKPSMEDVHSSIATLSPALDDDSLEVSLEMCPDDGMRDYAPQLYFTAGRDALRAVRMAMLAVGLEDLKSVLDFASGGGRALRYFKAAFPNAALTACDILPHQVEFCVKEFGATGVVSSEDPSELDLEGPFELIWCGSLLTHVNEEMWVKVLELFSRVAAYGGVIVFTTYGRLAAEMLRAGENKLNLEEDQIGEALRKYDETGFSFQTTRWDGDTLVSRQWVCTQLDRFPELDLLLYLEHGWMGQDVVACTRAWHPYVPRP